MSTSTPEWLTIVKPGKAKLTWGTDPNGRNWLCVECVVCGTRERVLGNAKKAVAWVFSASFALGHSEINWHVQLVRTNRKSKFAGYKTRHASDWCTWCRFFFQKYLHGTHGIPLSQVPKEHLSYWLDRWFVARATTFCRKLSRKDAA